MTRLLAAIDVACKAGAYVAAAACFALSAMLIVEVVTTGLMGWSQPWAVEYGGYLLALTLFAGAGWCVRDGGHIRVHVLLGALSAPARRLLDLAGTVFALGIAATLSVAGIDQVIRSVRTGVRSYYPSETLLAWPQALLATSFVLLALALLARLIRLARGESPEQPSEAGLGIE